MLLNYIIHLSLAVWKPLKTNGLSRVNAPTAPNCKKGPVACQEDDTHVKNTCERRQVSVKKQTIKNRQYQSVTHLSSENQILTVPGVREERLAILVAT